MNKTIKLTREQHVVFELGACSPCSVNHLIHALRQQWDFEANAYSVACALNELMKLGYVDLYDDATSW